MKDGGVIHFGLSSTDVEFLLFLRDSFQCSAINFQGKKVCDNPNSFRLHSKPSVWLVIVWQNWKADGIDILPTHFSIFFSIYTLAFWAMRSGHWLDNRFELHASRLATADKILVVSLLKDKLGLEAYYTSTRVIIKNPALVSSMLRPHFHASQLYRLERTI